MKIIEIVNQKIQVLNIHFNRIHENIVIKTYIAAIQSSRLPNQRVVFKNELVAFVLLSRCEEK